jgi:uncharacterized Ntn-hydrolase superfamily protein
MLGVAVSSSSPAVAARCAHVRAGVGAASSQNVTDPRLGPRLLDLLAEGREASDALAAVVAVAPGVAYRQLLLVDAHGGTGAFSGAHTLGRHAHARGDGVAAAGNLLAADRVPEAIVDAFQRSSGALAERLVGALRAGLDAGGEEGPVRSAGLLVADRESWPVADLRVDWHDEPITELERLWEMWAPQMDAYVMRALHPERAPGFGVPGDPVESS